MHTGYKPPLGYRTIEKSNHTRQAKSLDSNKKTINWTCPRFLSKDLTASSEYLMIIKSMRYSMNGHFGNRAFHFSFCLLLAIVCWIAGSPASLLAQQTDHQGGLPEIIAADDAEWFLISVEDNPVGSLQILSQSLEDGVSEYRMNMIFKVDFLGTAQEFNTTTSVMVNEQLRPERLRAETQSLSGSTIVEGQATEQGFVIDSSDGSETNRSMFSWDDELPLVADLSLPNWLQRKLTDQTIIGTQFKLRFLDTSNVILSTVTAELTASDESHTEWKLIDADNPGDFRVRLDADGALVDQQTETPPTKIVKTTRQEAEQLGVYTYSERELLIFSGSF